MESGKYYWVKTEGYHNEYLPFYFGVDGWRVEIVDKTVFISTYKLELLFGRGCIKREVDFDKDRSGLELGAFPQPITVISQDGSECILMADHRGMLVNSIQTGTVKEGYQVLQYKGEH